MLKREGEERKKNKNERQRIVRLRRKEERRIYKVS